MSFCETELLRSAFMRFIQRDNECSANGKPCARGKCGCDLEMQIYLDEAEQVTQENYKEWRQTWDDRYGPTIAVPKFTADSHESIDPMSELAEKVHPDKIIPIVIGDPQ